MKISNGFVWATCIVVVLGIAAHQVAIHRGKVLVAADPPSTGEGMSAVGNELVPRKVTWMNDPFLADPPPDIRPEEAKEPEPPKVVNPHDTLGIRQRMVDEQVQRMEAYALKAGADDPFALTKEEIEEFRARGDPGVW